MIKKRCNQKEIPTPKTEVGISDAVNTVCVELVYYQNATQLLIVQCVFRNNTAVRLLKHEC